MPEEKNESKYNFYEYVKEVLVSKFCPLLECMNTIEEWDSIIDFLFHL